ncbi:hypothetical protein ACFOLJ_26340 [Rugamonas sp. CCM 8940]|uniref:hypothetical protein n=1 Tax=Rugamonas sp. CCM 8940 TaxID=2765359 RepID=UPI0018F2C2D5|nr:hypothetical protein [Rugamonas sp. CCM 8940]MBJ7310059.1 hypothetical protein [Rugamonas sp. CCM 8940]
MEMSEVIEKLTLFIGERVSILGVFVMKNEVGYVVENESDIDDLRKAILVDVPNLKKILLSKIPAYGGGEFSYCDESKIEGVLMPCSDAVFSSALVDVGLLEVYKHGEVWGAIP